ncbi:MAG: UDP-N-acetylmuramoyl-L-alanyl-D-glutamate--2,6-diaminopimelate ligase [Clostridia bacterium]|nr:UDP-N-acetylmuramoyl-L-alanyl-D-glutamate--2,6-diaminopimelate ligase [Clostridia bacterium]
MRLSSLLSAEDKLLGKDVEIEELSLNSMTPMRDGLYFAIRGTHTNGENYVVPAISNGAVAVVCEKDLGFPPEIPQVIVKDVRSAMAKMANKFYGEPNKDMKIIMVTGTNGKTSTTTILKQLFEGNGIKTGLIGTNGAIYGNKVVQTGMTTPDPIELNSILRDMRDDGCKVVCMEASAHALALNKLDGIRADFAVLTNITQDHLDFFKNMENYANAKFKLFTKERAMVAIINADDVYGRKLMQEIPIPAISYGRTTNALIKADNIEQNKVGQSFNVCYGRNSTPERYRTQLDGLFNIENILGALSVAEIFELDREKTKQTLASIPPVPGRFNRIEKDGVQFIVDYAHTPDGIENILRACRKIASGRVIAVFGCGGCRDAAKRPLMGRVACALADYAIITSDNPRYEEPQAIIKNILSGIRELENYEVEVDRETAIKKASKIARKGDIVAVLGKGVENYMEINGKKIDYSDMEVIEKL